MHPDGSQKQKGRIDLKIGTDMEKYIPYNIMEPFFKFWFQIWLSAATGNAKIDSNVYVYYTPNI